MAKDIIALIATLLFIFGTYMLITKMMDCEVVADGECYRTINEVPADWREIQRNGG